jgi:hypothetical protein
MKTNYGVNPGSETIRPHLDGVRKSKIHFRNQKALARFN